MKFQPSRLPKPPWRTRFAPAPTGYLHLGHAVSALYVWGMARAFGGRVVLRIEDHDRTRSGPELEGALLDDLEWMGLEPDETVPRQSERVARYAARLAQLEVDGLVYACLCTRKEIRARSGGGRNGELRYPGTCRGRGIDPSRTPVRRLRLDPEELVFEDLFCGVQEQVPAEQCGDLLLRNRDGDWTYHYAVAVDDWEQGIDVVVRGEDLLASTGRQLQLARLLGRKVPPRFLHHPLLLDPTGRKLSKARGDAGVRELRAAGWAPERVLGEAARRVGLQEGSLPLDLDAVAAILRDGAPRGGP